MRTPSHNARLGQSYTLADLFKDHVVVPLNGTQVTVQVSPVFQAGLENGFRIKGVEHWKIQGLEKLETFDRTLQVKKDPAYDIDDVFFRPEVIGHYMADVVATHFEGSYNQEPVLPWRKIIEIKQTLLNTDPPARFDALDYPIIGKE